MIHISLFLIQVILYYYTIFIASSISLVYCFSSFSHVFASFLRLDFWVHQDFSICKQSCFIIHGGRQSIIMVFSYNYSNVGWQGRGLLEHGRTEEKHYFSLSQKTVALFAANNGCF